MIEEEKMHNSHMKALYIVVNAGFAEQVVDFIRSKGATGATIINSRGISSTHKEIFGISTDLEKEIILTLIDTETAVKIMNSIKEHKDFKSTAQGICFALPVLKAVGLSQPIPEVLE